VEGAFFPRAAIEGSLLFDASILPNPFLWNILDVVPRKEAPCFYQVVPPRG